MRRRGGAVVVALVAACGNTIDLSATHDPGTAADASADASEEAHSGSGSVTDEDDASSPFSIDASLDAGKPGPCAPLIEDFTALPAPSVTTGTFTLANGYGVAQGNVQNSLRAFLSRTGTIDCGVDVKAKFRIASTTKVDATILTVEYTSGAIEVVASAAAGLVVTTRVNLVTTTDTTALDLSTFRVLELAITPAGDLTLAINGGYVIAPKARNVTAQLTPPVVHIGAYHGAQGVGGNLADAYEVDLDDVSIR